MAVESKQITIIQLLLKRPEIDFKRESDAFKTAIDFDLPELLNLFLNHEKFDDLLTIKPFESYVQGSVRYGSKGVSLRVLLDSGKFSVNERTELGSTILYVCVRGGREEMIKILLTYKDIDLNLVDSIERGDTALHLACSGYHIKIVELLLADDRTDPNLLNYRKQTPLMRAVRKCDLRFIHALLACERVHVNSKQSEVWTALHYAVSVIEGPSVRAFRCYNDDYFGQVDIVRALIRAGADVLARTYNGDSPRDDSKDDYISEILVAAEREALAKLLANTTVCHEV
eukprot:237536_1